MYRIFPGSHRHLISLSQAFPPNSLPPGIEFSLLLSTDATGRRVALQWEGAELQMDRGIQQRVSQVQGRGGEGVGSKRTRVSQATLIHSSNTPDANHFLCSVRYRLQAWTDRRPKPGPPLSRESESRRRQIIFREAPNISLKSRVRARKKSLPDLQKTSLIHLKGLRGEGTAAP